MGVTGSPESVRIRKIIRSPALILGEGTNLNESSKTRFSGLSIEYQRPGLPPGYYKFVLRVGNEPDAIAHYGEPDDGILEFKNFTKLNSDEIFYTRRQLNIPKDEYDLLMTFYKGSEI